MTEITAIAKEELTAERKATASERSERDTLFGQLQDQVCVCMSSVCIITRSCSHLRVSKMGCLPPVLCCFFEWQCVDLACFRLCWRSLALNNNAVGSRECPAGGDHEWPPRQVRIKYQAH